MHSECTSVSMLYERTAVSAAVPNQQAHAWLNVPDLSRGVLQDQHEASVTSFRDRLTLRCCPVDAASAPSHRSWAR